MKTTDNAGKKEIAIRYFGDASFLPGLNELSGMLGFSLKTSEGFAVRANASERREITVAVVADGSASFTYYDKASFYRAFSLVLQAVEAGKARSICVKPSFRDLGSMLNCSAAVMNLPVLKEYIRLGALTGYNYLQLYTETTYEIPGEPYFGYGRAIYSQAELRELVAYAELFGVELAPCIQTLGHMANLFKWGAFSEAHDITDTMLADCPRTYELIENMMKSLSSCFQTDRINLGMDEAYYMGFGRYNWFIDGSKPDTALLFIRHLKKVLEIAAKYGFTRPSIWFDNLFGIEYKGYIDPPEWLWRDFRREILDAMPAVKLIHWNYVLTDVRLFNRLSGQVGQLSDDLGFATMAHGYTSFAPQNYITATVLETAKQGCLANNIDDMMITWWGHLISPLAVMPSVYALAEKCSESVGVDFEERFRFLTGYTYTEFCKLDLPDRPEKDDCGPGNLPEGRNPAFYMLANDPLLGIFDRHVPAGAEQAFKKCGAALKKLAQRPSRYAHIFRFEAVLSDALAVKCGLGKRIKSAYDARDYAELKRIEASIPGVAAKIGKLYREYEKYWHSYNKSAGWEIMDQRFGGLAARLKAVRRILSDYREGRIDRIEELESERLPFNPAKDGDTITYFNWNGAATSGT
ncbi:MAG: family 20 glycosylhydrolase [Clostridiales bacterium]|jgi:hypothetical protein|nr:family 20 glycosylhydrolase [Clostridiales bacterium]